MSMFDDGQPESYIAPQGGMGYLGPGRLSPTTLAPLKRNENVIYAERTGGASPAAVNAEIKRRADVAAKEAAKAAGVAGLGDDSRGRQQLQEAHNRIAALRARINRLRNALASQ